MGRCILCVFDVCTSIRFGLPLQLEHQSIGTVNEQKRNKKKTGIHMFKGSNKSESWRSNQREEGERKREIYKKKRKKKLLLRFNSVTLVLFPSKWNDNVQKIQMEYQHKRMRRQTV